MSYDKFYHRVSLRADPGLAMTFAQNYWTTPTGYKPITTCCRLSYIAEDDAYAIDAYHVTPGGDPHLAGRVQVAHADLLRTGTDKSMHNHPQEQCDAAKSGTCFICCMIGCQNAMYTLLSTHGCTGCTHPDPKEVVPEYIVVYKDRAADLGIENGGMDLIEATSTDRDNKVSTDVYPKKKKK